MAGIPTFSKCWNKITTQAVVQSAAAPDQSTGWDVLIYPDVSLTRLPLKAGHCMFQTH